MRISTNQMQAVSMNAMLQQQSKLSHTQLQLSTGLRITKPSDDPVASARMLELMQTQTINQQYQYNADAATARLRLEETILADMGNQFVRVKELALQGNNGSQSADSRGMIASELRQIQAHLLEVANTKDTNGEYIFAGYQGNTKPFAPAADGSYVYSGDEGRRYLQVGPTRRVADSNPGSEVYMDILNGNGTFTTMDAAGNTGGGVIDPGSIYDMSLYDGDTYTIHMGMATTTSVTGTEGVPVDFIGTDDSATLDYRFSINGTLIYSSLVDTPPADTSELADLINAQTATSGVRAYVNGTQLYLVNDPAADQPIAVSEELLGFTDQEDSVTGFFGSTLTGAESNAVIDYEADADSYVVVDSMGNVETTGTYAEQELIQFNGIQTYFKGTPNNGDTFTISPSANQDVFTTLQNLIDALEAGGGDEQARADLSNAVNRVLTDLDQAQINTLRVRADVGARLAAIDSQRAANEEAVFQVTQTLSTIQDLDYAEAISRLNVQLTALQAAQQTYTKVQGLSLFDYIG
ncbi:MAG: flagellar hook-associated protein FlgL [Candidatus Zixiibacteriota bacterium]